MSTGKSDFITLPAWFTNRWFLAAVVAVYLCAATVVAWRMLGRPLVGVDDANIFFVYARNFVHGHGIVYNVGGERVEGFSSLLYFAVCSICYTVTASPELLLFAFNVLFAILASVCLVTIICDLAAAFALSQELKLLLVAAYVLWLLLNPCYFAWVMVSLMDTALYSLLLTASFAFTIRVTLQPDRFRSWQLCLLIGLMILSRPEGIVWASLTIICCIYVCWRPERPASANLHAFLAPLAVLIAIPVTLALARMAYFGYPLPNTYYAKVSSSLASTLSDGRSYLASFFGFYGLASGLALGILAVWLAYSLTKSTSRNKAQSAGLIVAGFCAAAIFIPVLEGGDHFFGFRMYQPVYPLLFLALAYPLFILVSTQKRAFQYGYIAVLLVAIVLPAYRSWSTFQDSNDDSGSIADIRASVRMEFDIAASERENGTRLRQLFQGAMPTIGFGSAGGIAYGYQGTVYDMMGLNNARMAHADGVKSGPKGHQSFDKNVFYALAPDILMPRAALVGSALNLDGVRAYYTDPGSWDNRIFKGLFNDEQFRSAYTFALLTNSAHPDFVCYGYFNNGYLARLLPDNKMHVRLFPN